MMLLLLALAALCLATGATQCAEDPVVLPSLVGADLSWKEYLRNVYGESSATIDVERYKLNLLYKNTPTIVLPRDWKQSTPLDALDESWGDTIFRRSPALSYQHSEWAEVSRHSTYFLNSFKRREVEWEEGYSRGFPGRSRKNETKVPYGCWFNLAKGSGIFVNVGRTLIVSEKYHPSVLKHLELTPKACLPSDTTGDYCYDRLFCTAALAKGYDSVQVTSRSELVICSGKCATEPLRYACPPIPMRSGYNASGVCHCSDRSHILNCGDSSAALPNLAYNFPSATQLLVRRHKLCAADHAPVFNDDAYNLTLAFTSVSLEDTSVVERAGSVVHALSSPKSTLLVDLGTGGRSVAALPSSSERPGRHLRATPLGPHHHTFPPPPPILQGDEGGNPSGSYGADGAEHAAEKHRAEYFLRYRHDKHHRGINTETEVQAQWRLRLQQAGYAAVVVDELTASQLWAGGDIAVLSFSNPSLLRSTIVKKGDTKIGVIAYGDAGKHSPSGAVELGGAVEHLREYLDEAVCLRNAGVDLIVMMANHGAPDKELLQGLQGYVNLVIAVHGTTDSSCEGLWHAERSGVPVVQIKDASSVGVVHVQRQPGQGPSFRSRVVAF